MTSEKPGMSTGKKWLIGCGGCLGVLVVICIIVVIALQMGWSALQNNSKQAVEAMFGPTYTNNEEYAAIGLPISKPNIKNMVMLTHTESGLLIFAVETPPSPQGAQLIKEGTEAEIASYFNTLTGSILEDSPAKAAQYKNISLATMDSYELGNGKIITFYPGTLQLTDDYHPIVTALIAFPDNRTVALLGLDFLNDSKDPKANFESQQKALLDTMLTIVEDSNLDERMVSEPTETE